MLVLLGNSLSPGLRESFQDSAQHNSDIRLLPSSIGKFASTECFSEIKGNPGDLKNQPVVVIQSLASVGHDSANDFAMQLLFTVSTLKENGAGPIWVVMPCAGYARQDRGFEGRMPSVGIDYYASYLKQAGAEGVSAIEIHSKAGFKAFEKYFGAGKVFNLDPAALIAKDISDVLKIKNPVIGGPDAGACDRAHAVATLLNADSFKFVKEHTGVNETKVVGFSGDVKNKSAVTVDDMIDTGGTIENSQICLAHEGADERYVYAAHGIFSNDGLQKLFTAKAGDDYAITQVVVTDTIDLTEKIMFLERQYGADDVQKRIRQISVGKMLYEHIVNDIICHPSMEVPS